MTVIDSKVYSARILGNKERATKACVKHEPHMSHNLVWTNPFTPARFAEFQFSKDRKRRRGVQKSMGNKVPWKIGSLIYLPVTSRPFISLEKVATSPPPNLTACILNVCLPPTSRPMKRRTLSPWRACEVEVRCPPTEGRYPVKARQNAGDAPSAILSRKGLARYGRGYLALGR